MLSRLHYGRSSWQCTLPSPVCSQCCCLAGRQSLTASSHYRHTCQFPLLPPPEWVKLKLAVIVYHALHDTAHQYIANIPSQRSLRSTTSNDLFMSLTQLASLELAVAAPRLCQSLPSNITLACVWLCFATNSRHSCFNNPIILSCFNNPDIVF